MINMRTDCKVAVIEETIYDTSVHASEWWNGEGIDLTLSKSKSDEETGSVRLHTEELKAIVAIAIAFDMVDINECENLAQELLK